MIQGYYLAPCECGAGQENLNWVKDPDGYSIRCGKCGRMVGHEQSTYIAADMWNMDSQSYLPAHENPFLKKRKYHMPYFIVVNEWLYPTESGRDFVCIYDVYEQALNRAKYECANELSNYEDACGCDALQPDPVEDWDGVPSKFVITAKNGLDEWWFSSKIIAVEHGL